MLLVCQIVVHVFRSVEVWRSYPRPGAKGNTTRVGADSNSTGTGTTNEASLEGALSTPADHWRITYNPNSFAVAYTDSGALSASSSYSYFTHICTETYLGRY